MSNSIEVKEDVEVCACYCHTNKDIMHIMACCAKCPDCKKNIQFKYWNKHKCSKKDG